MIFACFIIHPPSISDGYTMPAGQHGGLPAGMPHAPSGWRALP